MKGGFVPQHFQLVLDEREGMTVADVLRDLVDPENIEKFRLNEWEREVIEKLIDCLRKEDQAEV